MSDHANQEYVGAEEFLSVSGGDVGFSRLLHMQLLELADGEGGETLKEMAREVLSGRVGLREATRVDAYQEEILSGIEQFKRHWDSLSPDEQRDAEREGSQKLDELRNDSD